MKWIKPLYPDQMPEKGILVWAWVQYKSKDVYNEFVQKGCLCEWSGNSWSTYDYHIGDFDLKFKVLFWHVLPDPPNQEE